MIYIPLADGFEEIEALEPLDIMRRAGLEAVTVGVNSKQVRGAHNIVIEADITIDAAEPEKMTMLVLPGGAGHELLDASNAVHGLINYAYANGIYIAAICASPSILGKKGLLENKAAVCFPGFEKYLFGAQISKEKVCTDLPFITAKGAGAAAEFGFKLVELLKDKQTAESLKKSMYY